MTQNWLDLDSSEVYSYQSQDNPVVFYYVPGAPAAEKDATGEPALLLLLSDQGALLQFGVHWGIDTPVLDKLRNQLARSHPELTPSEIRLLPAPVNIKEVVLALADAQGDFSDLQSSSASGFPPFAALFNVPLTAEQKARATSAVQGQTGLLHVSYRGSLAIPVAVTTTITGDVTNDITALNDSPSADDCVWQVQHSINEGRLKLKQQRSPQAPEELATRASQIALNKAGALLMQMVRQPNSAVDVAGFKVTAKLQETLALPIEHRADIGSWFPDGAGAGHILVAGGGQLPPITTPPSSSTAKTVRLAFDTGDAPIAFIQVSCGQNQATLRPSRFDPAALTAPCEAEPLLVKTNYTDGGPSYEVRLAGALGDSWVLHPVDLGLVQIEVDGTARQSAGAIQVRIHVLYEPSGEGSEDDRILYLKGDEWKASWFVVTRSADLAGNIEYDWKETVADGSEVRHPTVSAEAPLISL